MAAKAAAAPVASAAPTSAAAAASAAPSKTADGKANGSSATPSKSGVGSYAAHAASAYGFGDVFERNRVLGANRMSLSSAWDAGKLAWSAKYYTTRVTEQLAAWTAATQALPPQSEWKSATIAHSPMPLPVPWHLLPHAKLKALVRGGVPPTLRAEVWWACSGAVEFVKAAGPGAYAKHVAQIDPQSTAYKELCRDVDRTFTTHPLFAAPPHDPDADASAPTPVEPVGRTALRRVLAAFAAHNPSIGYCQAMSFVCATLLLFYDEECAFAMLCVMIERRLPHGTAGSSAAAIGASAAAGSVANGTDFGGYYTSTMSGARTDMMVLRSLARKRVPKLVERLDGVGMSNWTALFLTHFICLYVNSLPIESALRVWDAFFLEGDKVLFRVSLALVQRCESRVLKECVSADQLYLALSACGALVFDCDDLMHFAFQKIGSLSGSSIAAARKKHFARLMAAAAEHQKALQND